MSTERKTKKKGLVFLLPAVMALPAVAAMVFLMSHLGPTVQKLIGIMIKLAVTE